MVDAELSDVKETVEQLTDEVGQHTTDVSNVQVELDDLKKDVYYELDRDYYDLKDYVKRTNRRHEKKYHPRPQDDEEQTTNAVQLIADEYAEQEEQQQQQPRQNEIFIIIDENTVVSEDDEQEDVMLRPQV
jgi:ribonucleotide reductase alpha subunit